MLESSRGYAKPTEGCNQKGQGDMKDANHSYNLTMLILQNEERLKINGVLRGGGC